MKRILWRLAGLAVVLATAAPSSSAALAQTQGGTASWPQLLANAPQAGPAAINSFGGDLQLPPPGMPLFAGMDVTAAGVDRDILTGQPAYRVVLGDALGANAAFTGARGRAVYDSQSALPVDCDPSDSYCAIDNGYIVAGPPTNEYFTGLTVGDQPATAKHVTCCNGEYWSLNWYAPATDTSYGLDLALHVAARLGASGIDPSNLQAAQALADAASDLVSIRLAPAATVRGAVGEVPIKAAAAAFAPFTGNWWHHGLSIEVGPDGRGSLSWRVYRWCGPGVAQPCDSISANIIVNGGRAAVLFQTVDPGAGTAYGRVTSSSDPNTVPFGTFAMVMTQYGMADLRSGDQLITNVCGPQFPQLAPPAVQNSFPCGA